MADGIEQIESRLAAYIDGDLPESERAEIERYLASNPAHLQLIQELKTHKQYLASLPRESAPAEVLDHLQSHLERQALLENVENDANMLRINRWPQWGAIAATLFLAVGLGVLVFSVLPGGFLNHENIVIAPPSIQNLPAAPSLNESPDADRSTEPPAMTTRPEPSEMVLRAPDVRKSPDPHDSTGKEATNQISISSLNDRAENPSPLDVHSSGPETVMIVSTDDPLLTRNLLAGYLGQNRYDYASVSLKTDSADPETQSTPPVPATLPGISSPEQGFAAAKEDPSTLIHNSEQGLIVRNISEEDLQKIQEVINSQRGNLQQARLVHSAPAVAPGVLGAENGPPVESFQETSRETRSFADTVPATTKSAQNNIESQTLSVEPQSHQEPDSVMGLNKPLALQKTSSSVEQSASLPQTQPTLTTNVVIILRQVSRPPADETLSPQPITTQPVEKPTDSVGPPMPLGTPSPVPGETPATQPSPVP